MHVPIFHHAIVGIKERMCKIEVLYEVEITLEAAAYCRRGQLRQEAILRQ